jgi:hypothetical protein
MNKSLAVFAVLLMVVFAAACGKDETAEAPAGTTTMEQPGFGSPADLAPTTAQSYIDDVTIGSELAPDGSMVAGRTGDDFAPGQPIHLTMEVGDAPANSPVMVLWYGPNETRVGEETKSVTQGQKYLSFTAQNTASWAKGDYRAEVWIGDEKVNQQQFQIVDAKDAAN